MADDQADISKHFAMPIREKFTGHEFEDGLGGVPLISGAAGWLECIKESQHPGGDHTIFIGKVVRCSISGKFPLLFCGGSYLRSSGKWSPKAARLSNRRVREDDS
jgi:flavin reductase (DIM6/NTAB) family NADH-FMN oxidoreductase RutF